MYRIYNKEQEEAPETDLDQFRQPWESDEHWILRKTFMETYKNNFDEDKLVCLSQVFFNVMVLGCSYPAEVMEKINRLSENLPEFKKRPEVEVQVKEPKRQRLSLPKPSHEKIDNHPNTQNRKTAASFFSSDAESSSDLATASTQSERKKTMVRRCDEDLRHADGNATNNLLCDKLNLFQCLMDLWTQNPANHPFQILDAVYIKCGKNLKFSFQANPIKGCNGKTMWRCVLLLNDGESQTIVSEGLGNSKKDGYKTALKTFCASVPSLLQKRTNSAALQNCSIQKLDQSLIQSGGTIVRSNVSQKEPPQKKLKPNHLRKDDYIEGNEKFIMNRTSFSKDQVCQPGKSYKMQLTKKNKKRLEKDASETIVLIEHTIESLGHEEPAHSVLYNSATFNRVPFEITFEDESVSSSVEKVCTVKWNGQNLIAMKMPSNISLKSAKPQVAEAALAKLKETAYTVKIKKTIVSNSEISRQDIAGDYSEKKISSDNIGNKLLRAMGWSGGGLGKAGEGIEEPIKTSQSVICGRNGLGSLDTKITAKAFRNRIERLVQDYATTYTNDDLVFSSEFTKEERALIHNVARKYNLKNTSRGGQGAGRFLVLSKSADPQSMLKYLLESGGSTEKYDLIPPTRVQ